MQILTPMNRGCCGTVTINERLEALLNPGDKIAFRFGERMFKLGDKVMQIANNYDKSVFNGDMGRLTRIMRRRRNSPSSSTGRIQSTTRLTRRTS